MTTTTERC